MTQPPPRLPGRRIALGVTGSIAAYKAVLTARLLRAEGAEVSVVMTHAAERFVAPATFSALTGRAVHQDMFATSGELHVDLSATSDLLAIVPATADFLARLEQGRADDLLSALALCARCPILAAPAMHPRMWEHPATQRNVSRLRQDGRIEMIGPVHGEVASGEFGVGRMAEPQAIVDAIIQRLEAGPLSGRHLVVTAGPTQEPIDPVRFISNRSSGKMGFAVAGVARRLGADVTLIAGPVALTTPAGVKRLDVQSALELQAALNEVLGPDLDFADAVVMSAAVADYRLEEPAAEKLKREPGQPLTLRLEPNPDVIAELAARRTASRPLLVAFALETGDDEALIAHGRRKLTAKRCDLIVANLAAESIGREDNRAFLIDAQDEQPLGVLPKTVVAERIVDWISRRLTQEAAG